MNTEYEIEWLFSIAFATYSPYKLSNANNCNLKNIRDFKWKIWFRFCTIFFFIAHICVPSFIQKRILAWCKRQRDRINEQGYWALSMQRVDCPWVKCKFNKPNKTRRKSSKICLKRKIEQMNEKYCILLYRSNALKTYYFICFEFHLHIIATNHRYCNMV